MIIVGAGNLGKLVLDQMLMDRQISESESIIFFDEKTKEDKIWGKFEIIKNYDTLYKFCDGRKEDFFVAIGNSRIRNKYDSIMKSLGAKPINIISKISVISPNSVTEKHLLMGYASGILHSSRIGYSNIIHSGVLIAHGVTTGNYANISSNANLCNDCIVGDYSFIGTNAVVLPKIKIGRHCYVTAGTIVRENMKDYETR